MSVQKIQSIGSIRNREYVFDGDKARAVIAALAVRRLIELPREKRTDVPKEMINIGDLAKCESVVHEGVKARIKAVDVQSRAEGACEVDNWTIVDLKPAVKRYKGRK